MDVVANPHWTQEGCITCHSEKDAGHITESRAPDTLCLSCHDGRKAVAERHPVGRLFANPQVGRPEGWPAPEGRLSCITCHDVKAACVTQPPVGRRDRYFLRGAATAGKSTWCMHCHHAPEHERWNPHRSERGIDGDEFDGCRSCHAESMSGGPSARRLGEPDLVAPEPGLCLGCHPTHLDYFEPGHTGARVTAEVRRNLAAADAAALSAGATRVTDALPLASGEIVVCSTCHNPHEQGVFPVESVLAYGTMSNEDIERTGKALRFEGAVLCRMCHGPAPEFSRMGP